MPTDNETRKERKQKKQLVITQRLNSIMESKGYDRTMIRTALLESYDIEIKRQTFKKYQDGTNTLPEDIADIISQILEIDEGYLRYLDYPNDCITYEEYLEDVKTNVVINKHSADFNKYVSLFKHTNSFIVMSGDTNSVEYSFTHNKERIELSKNEMEQLYNDSIVSIKNTIEKMFQLKGGDSMND